jgi:hypothetical protein
LAILRSGRCYLYSWCAPFNLGSNVIDRNIGTGMLFLIGGIAQIFWVIPTVRRWGKVWYYIGMTGTLVLIIIWVTTRIPDNPITGRGGSISNMGFATELLSNLHNRKPYYRP